MHTLNLEKRGMRCLAIAESYCPGDAKSTLAGIVMRHDLIVDGFATGSTTLAGCDATDSVLGMYHSLGRDDISYILLWGSVLSRYNIVDVDRVSATLKVPVLGISGVGRADMRSIIKDRFPEKLRSYEALGKRHRICLHTGYALMARLAGCTAGDSARMLDMITLQGGVPEPARIARLLASALRRRASMPG